jgi:hypothetical protein
MNGLILKRYACFVHGFGSGTVAASTRAQAHYAVILYLRSIGESVPFTQPMNLTKLAGERHIGRYGVTKWQARDESEPQAVEGKFSLVGGF